MHIGTYLELVHKGQQDLAEAFLLVAEKHGTEPDIYELCKLLAKWSQSLVEKNSSVCRKIFGRKR